LRTTTLAPARAQPPQPTATTTPRWSEFTPEVEQLMAVRDLLGQILRVGVTQVSRRPGPKIDPVKRPRTALEKARQRQGRQRSLELFERLTKPQQ
jgi:hypothetical protein